MESLCHVPQVQQQPVKNSGGQSPQEQEPRLTVQNQSQLA